jgi:GTPase SAR1 family protein
VFDVTSRESFLNAQEHWLKALKTAADLSSTLTSCIMFVGNKVDLASAEMSQDANYVGQELHESTAVALGLLHQRASAKTCQNVRRAFEDLVVAIYDADKSRPHRADAAPTIQLDQRSFTSQPPTQQHPKAGESKCC